MSSGKVMRMILQQYIKDQYENKGVCLREIVRRTKLSFQTVQNYAYKEDPFGGIRRYRMIGGIKEYEMLVSVDGLEIPISELAAYHERKRAASRAAEKPSPAASTERYPVDRHRDKRPLRRS